MAIYRIEGADRTTGETRRFKIQAQTDSEAEEKARGENILIARVRREADRASPAEAGSSGTPAYRGLILASILLRVNGWLLVVLSIVGLIVLLTSSLFDPGRSAASLIVAFIVVLAVAGYGVLLAAFGEGMNALRETAINTR